MSWLQRQHTSDDADVISDRWQKEQKYSSAAAHPTGLTICYISISFLERCHRTLKQRFIPATQLLTKHKASILWTEYQLDYLQQIWNGNVTAWQKSRGRGKWNSCHAMLVHEIKQLRKICTASKKISTTRCLHGCSCTPPRQGSINSFQQELTAQNKI